MEKLLQKNYFLHQSARDGYRSYLQAYASYSLKKIFDVNKLDLAKVGKAFGFSVPPRVNVTVGGGTGGTGRSGTKRKWEEGDTEKRDNEKEDTEEGEANVIGEDGEQSRSVSRPKTKARRKEQLGEKRVDKDVYRNKRPKEGESTQWSR